MINIRPGIFETNSSSTHALVIPKMKKYTSEELKKLNVKLTIDILKDTGTPDCLVYYKTLEQKLSYLYTACLSTDSKKSKLLLKILKKVCPNVTFIPHHDKYPVYVLEDLDWLLYDDDEYSDEINPFLTKNAIINLLLDGEIMNISRDTLNDVDISILETKVKEAELSCKCSG